MTVYLHKYWRGLIVLDRRQLVVVELEFLLDFVQCGFIKGFVNHRLFKGKRFFHSKSIPMFE